MKEHELRTIQVAVAESAAAARENAGYSGSWGDGGASAAEERLRVWLDGVNYATTGVTAVYGELLHRASVEADPEYAEYQRLKEKFKT